MIPENGLGPLGRHRVGRRTRYSANSVDISNPTCVAHLQCPTDGSGISRGGDAYRDEPVDGLVGPESGRDRSSKRRMVEELCSLFGYDAERR